MCIQALGMLFWHKHNIEKSLADLPNFTPFPDEWTVEDKVLFEQAFSFHGKSFHRIQQMVNIQHTRHAQHICVLLGPPVWKRAQLSNTKLYIKSSKVHIRFMKPHTHASYPSYIVFILGTRAVTWRWRRQYVWLACLFKPCLCLYCFFINTAQCIDSSIVYNLLTLFWHQIMF